mmetsp:Transcript_92187/g.256586  ORF Transcript_92187/g.256586 Transcript_92187/m.256586 type:complete len:259 (+) Transcript_92187:378-1154(+)
MPRSCSLARSQAVRPVASTAQRSARPARSNLATPSWPCSQAKCNAVFPPGPANAWGSPARLLGGMMSQEEGEAPARKSSSTMSSCPFPAASQSAGPQALRVTKQLASKRRSLFRSPQELTARIAAATSASSSRPPGTQTAAWMSNGWSSGSNSDPGTPHSAPGMRATLRESSPMPIRNSSCVVATCSGSSSCQKSWPRKRKRPGPNAPPLGTPLMSEMSTGPAVAAALSSAMAARPESRRAQHTAENGGMERAETAET